MRLTASDFVSYRRPSACDLRVFLRHRREQEAEPGHYELVLRRLGLRHEIEHLATLGAFADVRVASLDEHVKKTAEAIAKKVPVLYQPAFVANEQICGTDVEIVGVPDYLILDSDGYVIRDSKMARRIDEENHPEILLQVQLYGWLFERSSHRRFSTSVWLAGMFCFLGVNCLDRHQCISRLPLLQGSHSETCSTCDHESWQVRNLTEKALSSRFGLRKKFPEAS